jgi:hypothetical protein
LKILPGKRMKMLQAKPEGDMRDSTLYLLNTLSLLIAAQFRLAIVGGARISHIYAHWRLIKIGVVAFCPTQTGPGASAPEKTRFVVGTKITLVLGQLPSLVWAKFGEKNGSSYRYYNSKGNSKQCELHHLLRLQPRG